MTHKPQLKVACPNPDCQNPELKNTGFRGGRWCPICKFNFTIKCFGQTQKPKMCGDY